MKLSLRMPQGLKPYFHREMDGHEEQLRAGNVMGAWRHLERAHVIGQAFPWQHSRVHWRMFMLGISTGNVREVLGQVPRLLVGGAMSFVGRIPVGNTGGANVPALQPMEIEQDLVDVLSRAGMGDATQLDEGR